MSFYFDENVGFPEPKHNSYNGRIIDKPRTKTENYTSVTLDPEFDLDLSGTGRKKPMLSSTIHPFQRRRNKVYGNFQHAVKPMLSIRSARRTFSFILLNLFVSSFLLSWCNSSNSLALRAFSYLAVFDLLTLITCLISIWASTNNEEKSDLKLQVFSYQRIEILCVFASVVLSSLGSVFILKESIIRMLDQPDVAIGRLLPGAFLGFMFHVLMTFSVKNKSLQCVTEASSSSLIQEHVADMSQSLCSVVPILGRVLLPRVNPFFLCSFCAALFVLITDVLIQIDTYYFADTACAVLISILIICTMWPIANCSARVLLNTTPPYVLGQLDKLLSQAQTLDGVLEIQKERFHTITLSSKWNQKNNLHNKNSFGLILAGSIVVRIRRDANEQMVLAHVTNKLSPLVQNLTVQVIKDDWSAGTMRPLGGSMVSNQSKYPAHSSIILGFNKPAAAVAPYHQTPPKHNRAQMEIKKTTSEKSLRPEDDFSFSAKPSLQPKLSTPNLNSSAGSNIARMYKAAGYTSPPTLKPSGLSSSLPLTGKRSAYGTDFKVNVGKKI